MEITWLGQAGWLFETNGKTILVDPYLSDSVAKTQPENHRKTPIDEKFLSIKPNMIILTHNHGDHLDKETLCHYLNESSEITVLAPRGAWQEVRSFGGKNNYIQCNEGTTWTEEYVTVQAVKAEHSDENAIGVILSMEEKHYYITGDTLYNEKLFDTLPSLPIYAVFLPINGKGNNMNLHDAKKFAQRAGAKFSVPMHFGTFDMLSAEDFEAENKVIPRLYKKLNFNSCF